MEMFVILTCLILSHGITSARGGSEIDKTSAKDSKKGHDEPGKALQPDKNADKAKLGENKENKQQDESKNGKPPGKEDKGAKPEGHELAEKKKDTKPGDNKQDKTQNHPKDKTKSAKEDQKGKPVAHKTGQEDQKPENRADENIVPYDSGSLESPDKEAKTGQDDEVKDSDEANTMEKLAELEKEEATVTEPVEGKEAQKTISKKNGKNKARNHADAEEMIQEESSRIRGEELEENEKAQNPELEQELHKKPPKAEPEANTSEEGQGGEDENMTALKAEEAKEEAENAKDEQLNEQDDADIEKSILEQAARERGKELVEAEKIRAKKPEETVNFSEIEKNVAKDMKKANPEKPDEGKKDKKPNPGESEEHGKAGDESKKEKTSFMDRAKANPEKSELGKEDKKPKPGESKEHEKAGKESKKEKTSFMDRAKGNPEKSEPDKVDQKSKPGEKGKAENKSKNETSSKDVGKTNPKKSEPDKGDQKPKPGESEKGKAGNKSKNETSSKDMEKANPKKSEPDKGDQKPKHGENEKGKAENKSKNETSSKDVGKTNPKKSEPDKGDQKPKPGESEKGKAGNKSKNETSSKDVGKTNPKKSEPDKGDQKPKPGESEKGKTGDESKKEKTSSKDSEKANPEKSDLGKGDQKPKPYQNEQNMAQDELEMEKALSDDGERTKREELELAGEAQKTKTDQSKQETGPERTFVKQEAEKSQGPSTETMSLVNDLTILKESKSVSQCIMNDLPEELRLKVQETDDAEQRVLTSYVTSETAPFNIIRGYTAAKEAERTFLKDLLPELGPEADTVLAAYKALRKGEAWNYIKLDEKFKEFFKQPSNALTQYQTLKADEKNTLGNFLNSPIEPQSVAVNNSSPAGVQAVAVNNSSPTSAQALAVNNSPQRRVQSVNITKRSFAGEASPKLERSDRVFQRRVAGDGFEAMENNDAPERGNGGADTTQKDFVSLEDETSSEVATAEFADTQNVHEKSSLVKFVILCSLIGELIVAFLIVIACRKQVAKWCMKRKRTHLVKNTEKPSHGYSQIDDQETEATEKSAHFSISVTTVDSEDHP